MINSRGLSYLTIMLILFQSFSAMANLRNFHDAEPSHLQQEDKQISDDNPSDKFVQKLNDDKNKSARYHDIADCDHCGHCHGTCALLVAQKPAKSIDLERQTHHFYYVKALIDGPTNQLLRPPKT